MDLNHFKTPEVTPMLVKLYDKHRLYDLANDKGPAARLELTGVISDLLKMDLSARESELIADVLIALLHQSERDMKCALAERLSVMPDVPLRLILELANEDIDVARPVLEKSSVLGDLDLIYIIKSKTKEFWQAIARRKALDEYVVDVLADTQDEDTIFELTQNRFITLSEHALSTISDVACHSERVAMPLIARDEFTRELAIVIHKHVGEALKQSIVRRYDIGAPVVDKAMVGITDDLVCKDMNPVNRDEKPVNEFDLIQLLKRDQVGAFMDGFVQFSGLSRDVCTRIATKTQPHELAIICRAKGVQKTDFLVLYSLSGSLRMADKTPTQHDMKQAIKVFDAIRPEKAQVMLRKFAKDQA